MPFFVGRHKNIGNLTHFMPKSAVSKVLAILFLGLILCACSKPVQESGSINVVFCPQCETAFAQAISNSENIKCSLYDVGSEIGSLLEDKKAEVITDGSTKPAYGTPIYRRQGIMHNKFCILSDNSVVTGSYNPTNNGDLNQNNVVFIESKTIAANYKSQFEALSKQTRRTIYHKVIINGTLVENYFCPEDNCEDHVLALLQNAQNEVLYLTYSFTSDPIGDLLLNKQTQGVQVAGICEPSQISEHSECTRLGAKVYDDTGLMHHKVFIVDKSIVVTGSYNPTSNGNEFNNENVLIIHDPNLAATFLEEYLRMESKSIALEVYLSRKN